MAIFIGIGTGTWIVFVNYFWEYFGKDDCSLVKYRTQSRPKMLTSKSAKKAGFRSFLKIMVVIKDNFFHLIKPHQFLFYSICKMKMQTNPFGL